MKKKAHESRLSMRIRLLFPVLIIGCLVSVTLSGCGTSVKLEPTQADAYASAMDWIEKSTRVREYAREHYTRPPLSIYVSPEIIGFDAKWVAQDVIRRNYVPGYKWYGRHTPEEHQLAAQVEDSLKSLDRIYNVDYRDLRLPSLNRQLSDRGVNNAILYFSKIKGNKLYAELLGYEDRLVYSDNRRGTSADSYLSMLFVLDEEQNVQEVYTAAIPRR